MNPQDEQPVVAFVLPQFHPIPDNDSWWGKGFTEWTSVSAARSLFPGHHQPRVPADLGFYDLRLLETQEAQAELASEHSVNAFCYWHYWFSGRRVLARPVQQILESRRPDFPFCLAWANETWSRRWLGEDQEVLLRQEYSATDDEEHASWLGRAFADARYLRFQGRPVFLVYRPTDHPAPHRFAEAVRRAAQRETGHDAYLVAIDAHAPGQDLRALGFDDVLGFEPQLGALPGAFGDGWSMTRVLRNIRVGVPRGRLKVYDEIFARRAFKAQRDARATDVLPCVYVGWDNTPRRGADGIVIRSRSTEPFRRALVEARERAARRPQGYQAVFINAWNEWAEGNNLEPDLRIGHDFLDVVSSVFPPRPSREGS